MGRLAYPPGRCLPAKMGFSGLPMRNSYANVPPAGGESDLGALECLPRLSPPVLGSALPSNSVSFYFISFHFNSFIQGGKQTIWNGDQEKLMPTKRHSGGGAHLQIRHPQGPRDAGGQRGGHRPLYVGRGLHRSDRKELAGPCDADKNGGVGGFA